MKVLVVGGGGREHALVWSLSKSKRVSKIYCAPGNGGIEGIAQCVPISVMEFDKLAGFAKENEIDLTVIGMDAPLAEGIADYFEERGLSVFGPKKNAAILESSKAFSKKLMKKYGIPTADYEAFEDYQEALIYVKEQKPPVVIKADGLALGKGVLICETIKEAEKALYDIMVLKKFGDSGNQVVVEEFLTGSEASLLCFCDGNTIVPMVSAQDYKRAFDGDKGLNTGGMGAISPSPVFTDEIGKTVYENICVPTAKAMVKERRPFKGVIYFGLMFTDKGPKVLEYNARFGDPETQAVLPRLKTDLYDILEAVITEKLDKINIEWTDDCSCCVVLASGGYPEDYKTGFEIDGIKETGNKVIIFHGGTKKAGDKILTSGGRVLGVTGVGPNPEEARNKAYEGANKINFESKQFRSDIGKSPSM